MKDELHTALGAVREGAQAIDNLSHLLKAKRVGSRALLSALASVKESCAVLATAFDALKAELCPRLSAVPEAEQVAGELLSGGAVCSRMVSAKLVASANPDAKERLALSELASLGALKLNKVLFLATALAWASHPERTPLEAVDVLRGLEAENGNSLRITLSAEVVDSGAFIGDARVFGAIVRLGVSLLLHAGETLPHVRIEPAGAGYLCMSIGEKNDPPQHAGKKISSVRRPLLLSISVPEHMPQNEAVLRSVASLSGIDVQTSVDGKLMRFLLSRTDAQTP